MHISFPSFELGYCTPFKFNFCEFFILFFEFEFDISFLLLEILAIFFMNLLLFSVLNAFIKILAFILLIFI